MRVYSPFRRIRTSGERSAILPPRSPAKRGRGEMFYIKEGALSLRMLIVSAAFT